MRRTSLLVPVLAAGVVVAAGVAMFATRGLGDAVLMIAVAVGLAGAYLLRHYARASLIYRHRPPLTIGGHAPATRPPGQTRDNIPRNTGAAAR
jgi:hypothetical protein